MAMNKSRNNEKRHGVHPNKQRKKLDSSYKWIKNPQRAISLPAMFSLRADCCIDRVYLLGLRVEAEKNVIDPSHQLSEDTIVAQIVIIITMNYKLVFSINDVSFRQFPSV